MGDFQAIAQQFVEFYYNTFDENRSNLASLYRDSSMLTFESAAIQGTAGIIEKLVGLPFEKIKHVADTVDAQPSLNNGIIVLVTGKLQTGDEERPMSYVQIFQLLPDSGSYYVQNDLFKLVYPA